MMTRSPMFGMFRQQAMAQVPGDAPIQAGRMAPPAAVKPAQTQAPVNPGLPGNAAADLQRLYSQNIGNAATNATGALQRSAAPMLANLNLARQGAQDSQNLGAAAYGAGRFQEGLGRNLSQQGVDLSGARLGFQDARLGFQDAQLGFGDRELGSQLMRANAALAGSRLGQAQGMLPFLLQYFGIGG